MKTNLNEYIFFFCLKNKIHIYILLVLTTYSLTFFSFLYLDIYSVINN